MCVPEERIRDEAVFCSNCGSEKIATKWVYRYKKEEPTKVSIDEKIKSDMKAPTFYNDSIMGNYVYDSCGGCSMTSIPVQLVLSCEACGYTVTKAVESKK